MLGNDVEYTIPSSANGITLISHINRRDVAGDPSASTADCGKTFTVHWTPDQGKDLTTDPPPDTVTVLVRAHFRMYVSVSTDPGAGACGALASASCGAFGPYERGGTDVGWPADIWQDTGYFDRLKVETLTVSKDTGDASIMVPMAADTGLYLDSDDGPYSSNEDRAEITPSIDLAGVALNVPDPSVEPAANPPGDGRNKYVFSATVPTGVVGNPAWTAQFVSLDPNAYASGTTFTSFDISGSGKTPGGKNVSGGAGGGTITQQFTYAGLPSAWDAFGDKTVTLSVSGLGITQTADVQLFFDKDALNHPGAAAGIPNWYYYWDQIPGITFGTHEFYNALNTGQTVFVAGRGWVSRIYAGAGSHTAAGTWGNATGIDLFAWVCRHEAKHLEDMPAWWGNNAPNINDDPDGDWIPGKSDGTITTEQVCGQVYYAAPGGYNPDRFRTPGVDDDWNYGATFSDCEDYCLHRQEQWRNGDADAVDWSYPGKQWLKDGKDYN